MILFSALWIVALLAAFVLMGGMALLWTVLKWIVLAPVMIAAGAFLLLLNVLTIPLFLALWVISIPLHFLRPHWRRFGLLFYPGF